MKILSLVLFFFLYTNFGSGAALDRVVSVEEYRFFRGLHFKKKLWNKVIQKQNYQHLLFLGDKPEVESHSIGKMLRNSVAENVEIWTTDLLYKDRDDRFFPRYFQRHLNHQEIFPLDDKKFDAVFARRLLCHCDSSSTMQTCGGLKVDESPMLEQFFTETIRVLSEHPHAFIFLHGLEPWDGRKESIEEAFSNAFEGVSALEGLSVYWLKTPNKKQRRFALYIGRSDFRTWSIE